MNGYAHNRVIVLDHPTQFPEWARVRIELFTPSTGGPPLPRRSGGVWKG